MHVPFLTLRAQRTYTCAVFGTLRSSVPHISRAKARSPPPFIGCFVPKHPDTLNPNGKAIIQSEGPHGPSSFMWLRQLQAGFTINLFFAVKLWGEPAASLPSPHTPHLPPTFGGVVSERSE